MADLIDLLGQRFGTYSVISRSYDIEDARGRAWWHIQCECGQRRRLRTDILRAGKSRCWRCDGGKRTRAHGFNFSGSLADIIASNSELVTECGCQIWTAGLDGSGYGAFRFNGRMIGAHRASWMVSYGPIPGRLHVLHRCDTPPCINPEHLFLGTPADNVEDMIRKGRHRRNRAWLYR